MEITYAIIKDGYVDNVIVTEKKLSAEIIALNGWEEVVNLANMKDEKIGIGDPWSVIPDKVEEQTALQPGDNPDFDPTPYKSQ